MRTKFNLLNKVKHQILTIIVAVSENQVIGKDNDLIWKLSLDLKRFKSLTSGHHIIMGRKTFDSFPVFSKDGKKITFSSNRDAENPRNTNIFIADVVDK